jgi:hypothetical protein
MSTVKSAWERAIPLHPNMLLLITQGTVLLTISWALWRILRRLLLIKSDLDNVPGPVSDSFLKGELLHVLAPVWHVVDPCRKEMP